MKKKPIILHGIPAAPGITIGKAYLLDSEEIGVAKRRIKSEDIPKEIDRFKHALTKTRQEIIRIKDYL